MKSSSEKITLKETLQIHLRAYRDLRPYRPGVFAAAGIHGAVSALSPYATVYLSARLINELAGARRPEVLWPLVWITLAVTAGLVLLTGALSHWKEAAYNQYIQAQEKLFTDKMLSLDFADVDNAQTHDLLSQVRQNKVWGGWGFCLMLEAFGEIAKGAAGFLGAIALTVSLFTLPVPASAGRLVVLNHPLFVALLVVVLVLAAVLAPICTNRSNQCWVSLADDAKLTNRIFHGFSYLSNEKENSLDIRMYNQHKIANHYLLTTNNVFGANGKAARMARGSMGAWVALGSSLSAVLTGLVYVFVCLKAWAGAFGVGSITQYVGAVTALSTSISTLVESVGILQSNTVFMRTIYQFLDIPNQMYQGTLTTEKRSDRQYEVEFRDVSFKYPGSDVWALRHVNMKFKVGERMAVVGENGSGKTTFIKLLCRLYDPQEGEILLNGIDIRKYNYRDYMNLFSVVFQDFQLLAQPLGDNVAGSQTYDRPKVRQALIDAGFGDRLNSLPQGLDTMLFKEFAEDGVDVSGGEAQKIAIARALYKNAPFIILDEPTAALDPIAEAEIYAKFNDIAGDKTAVYISHRLSSCKFCDEIAVFDHGQVIQQGTHDSLLADEGGKYYALWMAQAQYYTE